MIYNGSSIDSNVVRSYIDGQFPEQSLTSFVSKCQIVKSVAIIPENLSTNSIIEGFVERADLTYLILNKLTSMKYFSHALMEDAWASDKHTPGWVYEKTRESRYHIIDQSNLERENISKILLETEGVNFALHVIDGPGIIWNEKSLVGFTLISAFDRQGLIFIRFKTDQGSASATARARPPRSPMTP